MTQQYMQHQQQWQVAQPQQQMNAATIESALILGDLNVLTVEQRVNYYEQLCDSLGLNPLTKPFHFLVNKGRMGLYANKNCAEQLRVQRGIDIVDVQQVFSGDTVIVTVTAKDVSGRTDTDFGVVSLQGLQGQEYANGIMKAVTKAKRRVTLSLCGLGMLDETEIETIPNATTYTVEQATQRQLVDSQPQEQPQPQRCMSAARARELFGDVDNMADYVHWLKSITQGWQNEHDAIRWAKAQGVFGRGPHAQNSYDKLIREKFAEVDPVANQDELWLAWVHKVLVKAKEAQEEALVAEEKLMADREINYEEDGDVMFA